MADPVVHLTGGIPDSGTGNITTLGQTLTDGANATLGATTDAAVAAGAAATINGHLRSISRDIVGGVVLQAGANVIGAVTQSGIWTVSGTVAATQSGTWTVQPGNTANTTAWLVTGAGGTFPVTGTFWQATQPVSIAAAVTVAQATAANLNATVVGTVTAAQTTAANFKAQVDPLTTASWGLGSATQNSAVTTNGQLTLGQFNTSPSAITSGNTSPLQLDGSGNLRVNIMAGGAAGGTSSTIGAAMPSVATVAMGSVTTAAPTYTTATANSLSLNTAGGLRVDGSGVTQPVSGTFWQATQPVSGTVAATQSGTWTVQPGNTANTTAWLVTGTGGTFPATQSGAWTVNPTTIGNWGLAASTQNVASPTNGQLVQGQFNTAPTAITSGNSSPLQLDTNGNLLVKLNAAGTATPVTLASTTVTGTVAVTQSGAWSLTANQSVNTAQINGVTPLMGNGVTGTGSQRVTIASDNTAFTVNAVQSGAWTVNPTTAGNWGISSSTFNTAAPTNAVLVEGQYISTQAALTSTNTAPLQVDKVGRLLAVGALRTLKGVQKTSITVNTETTVVTAGAAGIFNDVYAFVVTNKSATAVFVDFRDATAGTVRMTLAVPASDTRGFTVPVDSAMVQAAAANNWTATVSSAVSSIEITALYVSNI